MSDRRRAPRRAWVLTLPVTIFGAIWLFSPWLYLGGLRVESARLVQAPAANAASRPGQTSRQIVVSFTTSQDLAAYRNRWRLPFIQAGIFACKDSSLGTNDEVATQGAGYFSDEGRVRALGGGAGPAAGRYAYQATFDDELTSIVDHEAKRLPAATVPGGLCFRLHGATLFSGSMRSATIPLAIQGG